MQILAICQILLLVLSVKIFSFAFYAPSTAFLTYNYNILIEHSSLSEPGPHSIFHFLIHEYVITVTSPTPE